MGWRSDWLYQLVFVEVERVWHRAQRDGQSKFGPAPDALLISEKAEADWSRVLCRGPVGRRWAYRGGLPELLIADPTGGSPGERRGMFYEQGLVEFCVAADRQRVLVTYTIGPRYGRGTAFVVVGQGARGRLVQDGEFWVS